MVRVGSPLDELAEAVGELAVAVFGLAARVDGVDGRLDRGLSAEVKVTPRVLRELGLVERWEAWSDVSADDFDEEYLGTLTVKQLVEIAGTVIDE